MLFLENLFRLQKVDWEVELAVVIGKTASDVKAADAYNYVLGYTIAQDISGRDWQKEKNMGQFLLGKVTFETDSDVNTSDL